MKRKLIKILSVILFCDPEDIGNVALHIPVGLATVAMPMILTYLGWRWQSCNILALGFAIVGATLGGIFGWGFVKYQIMEGRIIRDKCCPSIQGWLFGIFFGVIIAGGISWLKYCALSVTEIDIS